MPHQSWVVTENSDNGDTRVLVQWSQKSYHSLNLVITISDRQEFKTSYIHVGISTRKCLKFIDKRVFFSTLLAQYSCCRSFQKIKGQSDDFALRDSHRVFETTRTGSEEAALDQRLYNSISRLFLAYRR